MYSNQRPSGTESETEEDALVSLLDDHRLSFPYGEVVQRTSIPTYLAEWVLYKPRLRSQISVPALETTGTGWPKIRLRFQIRTIRSKVAWSKAAPEP